MKKLFLILSTCFILSCSSDNSDDNTTGQLSFNNSKYDFDHIYIEKVNDLDYPYFNVFLTKGTMSKTGANSYSYSNDFKRMVGFIIYTQSQTLNSGVKQFPLYTQSAGENIIVFRDNYSIQLGNAVDYETKIAPQDNATTQSRVAITKINNNEYSFDFNVITSTGVLSGYYRGNSTTFN